MSHNQLTSNNNVQTEEQDLDKVFDSDEPRPWFPTGDLKNLPTEIYSDCTLSKAEHQKILSVLHPIDNIEKVEEENARSKLYNDANKENLDSLHQTNLKDIYWKDFLFNIVTHEDKKNGCYSFNKSSKPRQNQENIQWVKGRCCLTRNQCNSRINMGNVPSKEDQTESLTLTRNGQFMGPIKSGPFCQQTECTTIDILLMAPRSNHNGSRHFYATMDIDSQNFDKNQEGMRNYMPNCTPMVFSELVSFANGYANRPTTALANEQPHDPRPNNRNHIETKNKLPNAKKEKLYNTIAVYKSAISEVYEYIDNLPVRWNQDIAKIMLGIFRSNPPAESGVIYMTLLLPWII
ncbi:22783_t:CDS:2 [Gigaspora rosea]|nr:22783_t:CDS:2 [Gigaspora rosea]